MVSQGYPLLSLVLFGLFQPVQAAPGKLLLEEQGSLALTNGWYLSNYEGRLQERPLAVEPAGYDHWVVNTGYQHHWQGLDWFVEAGIGTRDDVQRPLADSLDTRLELGSSYQLTPAVSLKARYDVTADAALQWKLGIGYRF